MTFVDTGAWVALYSKRDQHHLRAAEIFRKLNAGRTQFVTSSGVLYETMTLLARKVGPSTAIRAGGQILGWKSLVIHRPGIAEETAALALMEKYSDHPIGFVDCLSFVLMQRHRVSSAFAFDRHFEVAGFSLVT